MSAVAEILRAGAGLATRHRLRSAVTMTCVMVVLTPFIVGVGISRGVANDIEAATAAGPDLYLAGEEFGRSQSIPLAEAEWVRRIPGVATVTPRIIGRVELGRDRIGVTIVGLPPASLPPAPDGITGRLMEESSQHQVVVGPELARRLHLSVGAMIPPFYRNPAGERVIEVVGVLPADSPPSHARVMLMSLQSAAYIFDQPDRATDLLVRCRPGYDGAVRAAILQSAAGRAGTLRVVTREERLQLGLAQTRGREAAFAALYSFAFAVSLLGVLVTAGAGLAERRREVGILKALGWQTEQLLMRALAESTLLAAVGIALSIMLAVCWVRGLNGFGLAAALVPSASLSPAFHIPFQLSVRATFLAALSAYAIILGGTLVPTWRAAAASPREAMRGGEFS